LHHGWIEPPSTAIIARTVGDVVGNYRIIGKIGEGGMGAVSVAEHALIGRRAAIKVLLREMSHRQDLVTRFFNEARAATAVKHPGIVEIYDFGSTDHSGPMSGTCVGSGEYRFRFDHSQRSQWR
jgi:serine/threonine protein kinase